MYIPSKGQRLRGELQQSKGRHRTTSDRRPTVVLHLIERIVQKESHWIEHMLPRYSHSHLHRF
jgi:hypothetical protein